MTCKDCQSAKETNGLWRQYNPACLWCGARLINQIGSLRTPTSAQISARRRLVLEEWMSHGHQESELRRLAKSGSLAVEAGK